MTTPTGDSRPFGTDPTAALPTPPNDVPVGREVPVGRDARPPGGARRPAAVTAAGAVPLTPRSRDGRDGPDRRRKAPLAWLPWALLAGLLGLLALMLLAGTLAGGERPSRDAAGTASGAVAVGTLRVGDTDLLRSRAALGRLSAVQGQRAVGRGLRVQSVVADEGFWVGSSAAERVFVFLTPQARQSAGESGFQVRAGQTVDLNGTVTGTSPDDPERFGVTDAEGARQLTTQRAYVRASQVRLSASS